MTDQFTNLLLCWRFYYWNNTVRIDFFHQGAVAHAETLACGRGAWWGENANLHCRNKYSLIFKSPGEDANRLLPLKSFPFHFLSQLRVSGLSVGFEMYIDELAPQSLFWSLNVTALKLRLYIFSHGKRILATEFLGASFSPWWRNRFPDISLLLRY